jgi:hypothetical protein
LSGHHAVPFYWRPIKKQLEKVLKETRPDVIHAHNIFSAKMVPEFGILFVYDGHEYWPIHVKRQSEISKPTKYSSIQSSKKILTRISNI